MDSYDDVVAAALRHPIVGWDFSFLRQRMVEDEQAWSYDDRARRLVREAAGPVLDLGTGGGEFYAGLAPLPAGSAATEGWPPNFDVARQRLEPFGVSVVPVVEGGTLPLDGDRFTVVLDRHEEYDASEVRRVLTDGGVFLNQQVCPDDAVEINEALRAPAPDRRQNWSLAVAVAEVEAAGLRLVRAAEGRSTRHFLDVGALVYFLRLLPWQVPDFDVDRYDEALRRLHRQMSSGTPFECRITRFVLEARRS